MTSITVGGVTFNNTGAPDANGVAWTFSETKGWFDGAPAKGGVTDRDQNHGVFAERTWRGARLISVTGHVSAPTRRLASDAQHALASLLAEGTFGDFAVDDPDQGLLTSSVRGEGTPNIDWDGRCDIDCMLSFLAPDPLRYGVVVSDSTQFAQDAGGLEFDLFTDGAGADVGFLDFGDIGSIDGLVTLENVGPLEAWPTFTVTGPTPDAGFTISSDGRTVGFSRSVPDGLSLVIDTASGTAILDGADYSRYLSHREWWSVPPGGSATASFSPVGGATTATLTATLRPTFL